MMGDKEVLHENEYTSKLVDVCQAMDNIYKRCDHKNPDGSNSLLLDNGKTYCGVCGKILGVLREVHEIDTKAD